MSDVTLPSVLDSLGNITPYGSTTISVAGASGFSLAGLSFVLITASGFRKALITDPSNAAGKLLHLSPANINTLPAAGTGFSLQEISDPANPVVYHRGTIRPLPSSAANGTGTPTGSIAVGQPGLQSLNLNTNIDQGARALATTATNNNAAITPLAYGAHGDGRDETALLQQILDLGLPLALPKGSVYSATGLTIHTAGQAISGPGTLVMNGDLAITANDVAIKGVAFANAPNRCIVPADGVTGTVVDLCTFTNMGTNFPTSGAGGTNYSCIHIGNNTEIKVTRNKFRNIYGAQAIRIDGASSRLSILDNSCDTTYQRFVAVGTTAGANRGIIGFNKLSNIGLINNSTGVGATAIYGPSQVPQPGILVTGNIIDTVVENGIEGPWGETTANNLSNIGITDPVNHPTWNTPSQFAISSFTGSRIRGNRIDGAVRGINVQGSAIADIFIEDNIISNSGQYDIRISGSGTAANRLHVRRNTMRSTGMFVFIDFANSSEVEFASDNIGTITYSGQSPSVAPPVFTALNLKSAVSARGYTTEVNITRDLVDSTSTAVFRITAPAEGGQYRCKMSGTIVNNGQANASSAASLGFEASFVRVCKGDATGVTGTVSLTTDAVVATDPSGRTISSLVITTAEISEQIIEVRFTAVCGGSQSPVPSLNMEVTLVAVFSSLPALVQI